MSIMLVHIKTVLKVSVVIALGLMAANLIDIDHMGTNKLNPERAAKCATYSSAEQLRNDPDCACPQGTEFAESKCRGVFHNLYFLLFMLALTSGIALHLWMDEVIP